MDTNNTQPPELDQQPIPSVQPPGDMPPHKPKKQMHLMIGIGLLLAGLAAGLILWLVVRSDESKTATTTETQTVQTNTDDANSDNVSTNSTNQTATTSIGANTAEVVTAVEALIDTLSAAEQNTLMLDYGDTKFSSAWSNLPACDNSRAGIKHGDITSVQQAAVLNAVKAALSDDGYNEYIQIIAADDVLASSSNGSAWSSDCYYFAVYGTPSATAEWAIQFGGHHYARMITYKGDTATITPAFTGVEPISFTYNDQTVAPVQDEVDAAFAILTSLSTTQQAEAQLSQSLNAVVMGPGSDSPFPAQEGIKASDLTSSQQQLISTAINKWVGDFDSSIALSEQSRYDAEIADTYISWSGSADPSVQDAYVRIDGPSVWIEVVIEGGIGSNDVHHHTIFRDKANDYGTAN